MIEEPPEIRALRLLEYSPIKRQKFREIDSCLGSTHGLSCLELGSGNGVISLLLRKQGGKWVSADPDADCVKATETLLKEDVCHLTDHRLPFPDDQFDRIVIADCLEHIEEDRLFIQELHRVAKSRSVLIVNVPCQEAKILDKISNWLVATNENHGHVRDGYDPGALGELLHPWFTVSNQKVYLRLFSQIVDFGLTVALRLSRPESAKAGVLLDLDKMNSDRGKFTLLGLLAPLFNFVVSLDSLLPRKSGRMLIATALVNK